MDEKPQPKTEHVLDDIYKVTMPDGTVYEGQFKDSRPDGKGKLKDKDGNQYEGEFSKGAFNGKGKMLYADGRIYEGEF